MAIYAPILASSQPAFEKPQTSYTIKFNLSSFTNFAEVGCVSVKIVNQKNNKTVVDENKYPDGIVYISKSNITSEDNGVYSVEIFNSDLKYGWTQNMYYKVQIRLCKQDWISGTGFAAWKEKQIKGLDGGGFSEWSTVMVLKCINPVSISIINHSNALSSNLLITDFSENIVNTTTPVFYGSFKCDGELEDKFKFEIYKEDGTLLKDSGWLQHNSDEDPEYSDSYRFKETLQNNEKYYVVYSVITVNLFETSTDFSKQSEQQPFSFQVLENYLDRPEGISLKVVDDSRLTKENGCIDILLNAETGLTGNFVLSRASELDSSDYSIWEDLYCITLSDKIFHNELFYRDFTVESGIKYKYRIQQENVNKLRTVPIYEDITLSESPTRMVNFEYSFIFAKGLQLKIKFNENISSFKKTVLAAKQDTLGSKYPTVSRNGYAYYAEFPIKGLISLHADEDNLFFKKQNDGYYQNGEKIINVDKYIKDGWNTYDINPSHNNIFIERKYKDAVEAFLNDGEPKLFKSATEGNFLITLMNVSATPNQTLGRMIGDFSATAYEIDDNTISNLNKYGVIEIGDFSGELDDLFDKRQVIGQIAGLFEGNYRIEYTDGIPSVVLNTDETGKNKFTDLRKLIEEENIYDLGNGYQYEFESLDSIWIEAYPQLDFAQELNEITAQLVQARVDEDDKKIEEYEKKLEELNKLKEALKAQVDNPMITMRINNVDIVVASGKKYVLSNFGEISSLSLKYTAPIVLNYICTTCVKPNTSSSISAIVSSSLWGQLVGVFTTTSKIIKNYGTNEGYNFNLYESLNILDIIKNEAKAQVETAYGRTFNNYNAETKQWDDGTIYYSFNDITSLEIEADKDTVIIITDIDDNEIKMRIGATEKYRLKNATTLIKNLAFEEPTYAIINYRCSTTQMEMGQD